MLLHTRINRRLTAMLAVMAVLLSLWTPSFAAYTDTVTVKADGKALQLESSAFESESGVMLPLRNLMENMGRTVTWISIAQGAMVTGGDAVAVVYADKAVYEVNGTQKTASTSAVMYNDTLYCSADAAADILLSLIHIFSSRLRVKLGRRT